MSLNKGRDSQHVREGVCMCVLCPCVRPCVVRVCERMCMRACTRVASAVRERNADACSSVT